MSKITFRRTASENVDFICGGRIPHFIAGCEPDQLKINPSVFKVSLLDRNEQR